MGAIAAELGLHHQEPQRKYLRTSREKGSRAFHLEYDAPPTREELTHELISYLAEYRLAIPKYSYELLFGRGVEGDHRLRLRGINRGEPVGNKTKRVIEERIEWLEPTEREKAEDQAIILLDGMLPMVKTGDTLLWASPPGPKEQGYGEHGFLFVGKATELGFGEAHLAMTAIRIEDPKEVVVDGEVAVKPEPWVAQVNKLLSDLTGRELVYTTREQILANPTIVSEDLSSQAIDKVIKQHFAFEFDRETQASSEAIIAEMRPLIDDATLVMLAGTKEQRQKTLYALENYALALKAETKTQKGTLIYKRISQSSWGLGSIIDKYGNKKPPVISGSCGASTSLTSKAGKTLSDIFKQKWFSCSECGWKADGPIGESACGGCGFTKEKYKDKYGVVC